MKILVSNIGSTSFKFRLFDMTDGEREIAAGGADRIGGSGGALKLTIGEVTSKQDREFTDQGQCIQAVLDELVAGGALTDVADLGAVAFKAVMAGDYDAVARVDSALLERMEYFVPVAPAHNPPYIAAMRMFGEVLGDTPLVAAFEPGFHKTIPPRRYRYAVPAEWAETYGIRRYGFHGASHRFIATRVAELMPDASRVIGCHLGGSSSICALQDGVSQGTSMGLSPQSGLPQGNRVGDLDPFALKLMTTETGRDLDDLLAELGGKAGMAALSNTGGDMRDVEAGVEAGDEACQLALDVYVTAIRDSLGAFLVELGGADVIAFTGGIGEMSATVRGGVLSGLEFAGITLDADTNEATRGEGRIDAADSSAAIWVLETNEELIVARQAVELLGA